jgi:hypothetical protein
MVLKAVSKAPEVFQSVSLTASQLPRQKDWRTNLRALHRAYLAACTVADVRGKPGKKRPPACGQVLSQHGGCADYDVDEFIE